MKHMLEEVIKEDLESFGMTLPEGGIIWLRITGDDDFEPPVSEEVVINDSSD